MAGAEQILDSKYNTAYEKGRLALVRELVPEGRGEAALDLGCGAGFVSEILTRAGWAVTAVDLHPDNVRLAERRVARVIRGDALTVCRALPGATFCLVCVLELIEHLDEEERVLLLREARRIGKAGAMLLLSTPNRMSPDGLYGYYYAERLRGVRYEAWDPNHKRIYSSFETLACLRRAGWRPVKVVGYYYGGRLSLPLDVSFRFPLNRFGFNTLVVSR